MCVIMRQICSLVGAATRTQRHLLRTGSITCTTTVQDLPFFVLKGFEDSSGGLLVDWWTGAELGGGVLQI